MNKKLGLLILHGVGVQKADYSNQLQTDIKNALGERAADVDFQEVLYADIFDDNSHARAGYLINTSFWFQLVTRAIRHLLIFVLSDAVSYRAKYKEVHQRISSDIEALQGRLQPQSPIIIIAHSMGVMAISDYLYDQQEDLYSVESFKNINDLRALISFGCNIPLFEMGHDKPRSIKRPSSDVNKNFYWKNFYSPFDVLGYRIADYYAIRPEPVFDITDSRVYSGGLVRKWNILSHVGYWKHRKIIKAIEIAALDVLATEGGDNPD